ncbi:MAG: type II secretion system F family protein [Acidobacteriaceae bacterium]
MTIASQAVLIGVLVTVSIGLLWLAVRARELELDQLVTAPVVAKAGRATSAYRRVLESEAAALGQPELGTLLYRTAMLGTAIPLVVAVLFRLPVVILFMPVALFIPLVVLREARKTARRRLESQTRLGEVLLSFLLSAGVAVTDALKDLEREMDSPFRDRIAEVNVQKQFTTLPHALERLAQSTGVSQLGDFAVLVGESESFGTPVAQALQKSLALDLKLRDVRASRRYGQVELELAMYATLFIAFPGFGFLLYAILMYVVRLLGGMVG